jgi:sialic acid synthase SpsE
LYCVAKYPTAPTDLNFGAIDFQQYSGFSDHTIGIDASLVAMARGARIIEKHFTLSKEMPGPDHAGSVEPGELAELKKFADSFSAILYHGSEDMAANAVELSHVSAAPLGRAASVA